MKYLYLFILISPIFVFAKNSSKDTIRRYLFSDEIRRYVYGFESYEARTYQYRSISTNDLPLQGDFLIELGGVYDSLIDDDNQVTLVSEFQPKLALTWMHLWNKTYNTFIGMNLVGKKYIDLENNKYKFKNKEITHTSTFFGIKRNFVNSSVQLKAIYGDKIYFKEKTEDEISLEKDQSVSLELVGETELFSIRNLSSSAIGMYQQDFGGKKDFKSGNLLGGGFKIKYKFGESKMIESKIIYSEGDYKTEFNDFKRKNFSSVINFNIGF